MKRLIVCCDGTWNSPEQEENGITSPTNVVKIYNALAEKGPDDVEQLKYYHPGVGGQEAGLLGSVLGGAVGFGISREIRSAYHWLGSHYEEGDQIFLFGFSRGAFTVRSLGGWLKQGLLNLQGVEPADSWSRVRKGYHEGYREKGTLTDWAKPDWAFFNNRDETPIHFIGVFDTVGSLGIANDLEVINFLDNKSNWNFHNTSLGFNVSHGRHAMALDERRASFTVTPWENASEHPDAVELWFPGTHGDIGGSYADCDLANGVLKWMLEESGKRGLHFRPGIGTNLKTDPLGALHNSFKGLFAKLRSRPRNVPAMIPKNKRLFHASALTRQEISPIQYPRYYPTRVLEPGESVTVEVYAKERWNPTSIYLPEGHMFTFSSTGEWQDSKDSCDWKGTENDELTIGDITRAASSFLGRFEDIFKKLTKNQAADFHRTKRVEYMLWFTMVGAITNDNGKNYAVEHDGTPAPHQLVELPNHETTPLKVEYPGYLYCFPNDVWSSYENNHGSVQLTITRVK